MLPVSLDVALLKLQLPELVLRPGMQVVARVASRGDNQSASLVLAGALLKATVPDEVSAGDTLRLTVAETSPERVVLKLDGVDPAAAAAAALAAQQPEPEIRRVDDEREGSRRRARGEERPGVSLAYETPALGRLDLRIERGPEGVIVSVGAPAQAFGLAEAGAAQLIAALEAKTGTPASVRVIPRREPFDAYA